MGRYKKPRYHCLFNRLDILVMEIRTIIKCVKYNKTILTLFKKQNKNGYYGHGSTILCALLSCLSGTQD